MKNYFKDKCAGNWQGHYLAPAGINYWGLNSQTLLVQANKTCILQ